MVLILMFMKCGFYLFVMILLTILFQVENFTLEQLLIFLAAMPSSSRINWGLSNTISSTSTVSNNTVVCTSYSFGNVNWYIQTLYHITVYWLPLYHIIVFLLLCDSMYHITLKKYYINWWWPVLMMINTSMG